MYIHAHTCRPCHAARHAYVCTCVCNTHTHTCMCGIIHVCTILSPYKSPATTSFPSRSSD